MNKVTITALEPQKKHPGRRSVFVDGQFAFGLEEETCIKLGIHTGLTLTQEELEQVREEGEVADAKAYGFRLIARRSYSVSRFQKKLSERDYSPKACDRVAELMSELGYLNDAAYAKSYVHDATVLGKKGHRLILQELYARGIDRETAEAAVEDGICGDEVEENLQSILEKRLKNPSDPKEVRRVFQYCIRRGYDYAMVREAMGNWTKEDEDE